MAKVGLEECEKNQGTFLHEDGLSAERGYRGLDGVLWSLMDAWPEGLQQQKINTQISLISD